LDVIPMKFTPAQLDAIQHDGDHLQLIACAGSGKTEVVARRVAALLDPSRARPLTPSNIVAFTFTEKAAGELKQRIIERTREARGEIVGMAEMFVGTIHAFCLDLLTTEVPEYLKFEVLNEVQQGLLIDRNSAKSGLTTTLDLKGAALRRYIDTSNYTTALQILREDVVHEPQVGPTLASGLTAYQELLRRHHYLDYSSIMDRAVDALENRADVRERLGQRIRHVIVDEYQDVNPIQERLVRALATAGAQVCVVGDDDQTIYQWRGSDVSNILKFSDRYSPVQQVRLQENFRSSEGVVDVAREFIKQNAVRLDKAMIATNAQPDEKGDIQALAFENPDQEAQFIVAAARELRGVAFAEGSTRRGLAWSDMAILLRSVAKNAGPITAALDAAEIPYVIEGMNNLFCTAEAEAARQLFYFMDGRIGANDLVQFWTHPRFGFTADAVREAVKKASKARNSLLAESEDKRWSLYNLQRQFLSFLEDLGVTEESITDGEVVLYNLGKFSQLISDFESIHFHSDPKRKYEEFANFLQYSAEGAYPEGWQDNQYANVDAVRIMTVHKAKGMQWPVVFVPALLRNRFPSPRMGGRSVWHILDESAVDDHTRYRGSVEDERRLFYVAVTRSQKFLFLTYGPIPEKNNRYARPSEFWDNVLVSKFVKRRRQSFADRERLPPEPKKAVANVTLSFSDVKYFFECPYQFKLRILYGFNAPLHEALGYGKSLHDALAEVHSRAIRGDIATAAEVDDLVARHLHVPYAYPSLRETLAASARKVVDHYLTDNAELLRNVEFSEKTISIDLGDGINVSGRIDLVRRLDTDETTIVDLKSKDRVQAEAVTETQLHIYALGYRELTGRDADYVEIYNLEEREKKPRSVDEDFIDEVQGHVRKAANSLRANDFPPKAHQRSCTTCDYLGMCGAGQRLMKAP
jgi:DNA helicase-2/ATP-dependent DNA helicase PcrA